MSLPDEFADAFAGTEEIPAPGAVITAAVRAILQASPEDALRFAREVLAGDDVAQTLERLNGLMDGVRARKSKRSD